MLTTRLRSVGGGGVVLLCRREGGGLGYGGKTRWRWEEDHRVGRQQSGEGDKEGREREEKKGYIRATYLRSNGPKIEVRRDSVSPR